MCANFLNCNDLNFTLLLFTLLINQSTLSILDLVILLDHMNLPFHVVYYLKLIQA